MSRQGDKLRVMLAILTLERAGAQEVVRMLANHLQVQGCSVIVCTFQDGPVRAEIEKLGVPVETLWRPRHSVVVLPLFLVEMLRLRREWARLIERYQVDVLETHLLHVLNFLALSLRTPVRLRLVLWTMHNVQFLPKQVAHQPRWMHRLKTSGYLVLYRWLTKRVDGFIAISDGVRDAIIQQMGSMETKVYTINNGVDLEMWARPGDKGALCQQLGITSSSYLIATVGRLTEQKGHRFMIEAAVQVTGRFPDAHLLVIGDGELRHSLTRQTEQSGLAGNVHFLGVREDMQDLLGAIDLFVLPSLWEGLSMALLEAMAAAKPIVATVVSGTVQALIPGVTGLVVPPGDSSALAEAMICLISDRNAARAMGQAARQHVAKNFSGRKCAEERLALYRRLLEQGDRT